MICILVKWICSICKKSFELQLVIYTLLYICYTSRNKKLWRLWKLKYKKELIIYYLWHHLYYEYLNLWPLLMLYMFIPFSHLENHVLSIFVHIESLHNLCIIFFFNLIWWRIISIHFFFTFSIYLGFMKITLNWVIPKILQS